MGILVLAIQVYITQQEHANFAPKHYHLALSALVLLIVIHVSHLNISMQPKIVFRAQQIAIDVLLQPLA